jgi:hypothetical protein
MLILFMLSVIFAVLVIMFLIQYRSYNHSQKKLLSVVTPLTEKCDITSNEPSDLQLPLTVVVTG